MTQKDFLAQAAAQRAAAANTDLPNRRAMHERSAATWEAMAQRAADTAERAAVNEREKLASRTGAA